MIHIKTAFLKMVKDGVKLCTDPAFLRLHGTLFIGCYLCTLAINGVIVHQTLISAGLTGISLGIYYFIGFIDLSYIYFSANLVVLYLCREVLTRKHLFSAFMGNAYYSVSLYLTKDFVIENENQLYSLLIAASLLGVGTGLYLRYGGTAGGTDVIALYMRKKFTVPMSATYNLVNGSILMFAYVYYDIDVVIYSAVLFFVFSFITEKVAFGFSERHAVYIITQKHDAVSTNIHRVLDREYSFLDATGGYSGGGTKIILVVINMKELAKLKKLILDIDADAFITVFNTDEVIGGTFSNWDDMQKTVGRKANAQKPKSMA